MPSFDSYLVREEDGTSRFTLEDGSGSLLLETAVEVADSTGGLHRAGRRIPLEFQRVTEDEDAIAAVLALL